MGSLQDHSNGHQPFSLDTDGDTAVLLVHGIYGSPRQFSSIAQHLQAIGFASRTILLKGHGGSGRDFRLANGAAWQETVREEAAQLKKRYTRVFLMGHSLGGLLCLQEAHRSGADGVITLCAPLSVKIGFSQITMTAHMLLGNPARDDERMRCYRRVNSVKTTFFESVLGINRFFDLIVQMKRAKQSAKALQMPTLILQSRHDESVWVQSARRLNELLGQTSRLVFLEHSTHAYYPPEDEQTMVLEIERFLVKFGNLSKKDPSDSIAM